MAELSSAAWTYAGQAARQLLVQRAVGEAVPATLFRVELSGEHQETVSDVGPIEEYLEHLVRQGYDRFIFAHDTEVKTPEGLHKALVLFVGEGANVVPVAFLHQQKPMGIAGVPNAEAQAALVDALRGDAR